MIDDDIELIPDPPHSKILINTIDNNTVVETSAPTIHLTNIDTFSPFLARIRRMNTIFELEVNDKPTDLGEDRLNKFYKVIWAELNELGECTELAQDENDNDVYPTNLVALADVLGDLIVYITSEAQRWGIPILAVLHAIMDSQDSKLVDGKPLKAPDNSKFIKGPNFIPPETRIKEILESCQED